MECGMFCTGTMQWMFVLSSSSSSSTAPLPSYSYSMRPRWTRLYAIFQSILVCCLHRYGFLHHFNVCIRVGVGVGVCVYEWRYTQHASFQMSCDEERIIKCVRCHDNWLFIWFGHVGAGIHNLWTMYIAQSAPLYVAKILFYSFCMNAHRSTHSCVRTYKQIHRHIKTETFPRGNFAHWNSSISSSFFPIHSDTAAFHA